jgi:MFS family permease
VTTLALPLTAVLLLHASTLQVSALTAASWLPAILGAVAGTWIDRRPNKRALLMSADLGRAAVLLSLPAAVALGHVTLVQLYLVALLAGTISLVFNTSYTAFFARLVPQESYIAANSRLSASQSVAYVAGPALGGALVQVLGAPMAVLADALSFLASAAFISRIRLPKLPKHERAAAADEPAAPSPSFRRELREGWDFVVRDPIMRASLAGTTTINFFTFLVGTSLVVLYATRTLGLSAATIGATLGIGATGSLLGALLAGRVARRLGVGPAVVDGRGALPGPARAGRGGRRPGSAAHRRARGHGVPGRRRGDALRREPERDPGGRRAGRPAQPRLGRVQQRELRHPPDRRPVRRPDRRPPGPAAHAADRRRRRQPVRALVPRLADPPDQDPRHDRHDRHDLRRGT